MPNSNEEPLRPAGKAAPAPVSTPVDSVSEVKAQLASAKLSDQDEATPPADAAAGDTNNPKEDPDLWKPHPPKEECPVCLVPLPLKNAQSIYWSCCGKMICNACREEHKRALNVTNKKRDKKKQPPLEFTCPFCRSPLHKNDSELISRYEERIGKDDTRAMVQLGKMLRGDRADGKKDEAKAFELFHRAADLGSAEAVGQLGTWALNGCSDSIPDRTKTKEYFEKAAVRGDVLFRATLASLLAEEENYDLAIKHWHLAAAAGAVLSMKSLWQCFSKGKLSKPDLEKALRAHKAALDEINSEDRKRFAAWRDAEAGTDKLLKTIYNMYYLGHLNAKELEVALKAHRSNDWGEVEPQLKTKIQSYIYAHTIRGEMHGRLTSIRSS